MPTVLPARWLYSATNGRLALKKSVVADDVTDVYDKKIFKLNGIIWFI